MGIVTIGTGKMFTTLEAWEATLPATLLVDEIAECYGAGVVVNDFGRGPDISGVTTSAMAKIIIRAAAGQETTFKRGTGPILKSTVGGTWPSISLRNGADHVDISGLEIEVNGISSNIFADFRSTVAGGSLITVNNCYAYTSVAGDHWDGSWAAGAVGPWEFTNCLSVGTGGFIGATVTAINCTAIVM